MGSDRARVSYDPGRHWRGVINQQGRVTLEADWNEAAAIAAEAERAQLVDVIGPSGTPDDGYAVVPATDSSGAATGDLTIQQGTLYVGGERMALDADVDYASQPDWIDSAGDPLWVDPAVPDGDADEAVYLLLREQEVGAVEDPALLDVALGGPDTSERLRIVQRVVRRATGQTTCSGALGDLEQAWAAEGLAFDATTMRLDSASSLQVSFQQPPGATTACEPVAQGGYLGAENQLIRVQVASVDANGVPTLVWGFDNAYFLYRIAQPAVDEAGATTTVTLASAPVDSYHQPQAGQAVELLEAAAELTTTDYIAATTGILTAAASAYQPDSQQLVLSTALAAPQTGSPQLFLRVWQETIAYTGSGPVALADTGIQVTLASGTGVYHPGDYWVFAVRPGTPTTVSPVYPQRILDAPQPPDGPRLWACPLAVIAWAGGVPTVTDCRQHFSGLTSVTGAQEGCCCTIEVSPDDVAGGARLQELINRYAGRGSATICLQPGTYTLPRPLVIKGSANLTIRGCAAGAQLEAAADPDPAFRLGLILVDGAGGFTLRGVELALPLVGAELASGAFAGLPEERQQLLNAYGKGLDSSIGVYLLGGRDIVIESCTFSFDGAADKSGFGVGVFAATSIDGLQVADCTFSSAPEAATLPFGTLAGGGAAEPPFQVRFGYLQVPTPGTPGEATAAATPALPTLANASFDRNVFDGLTVAVLVIGQIGTTRVEDNTVRSCYGGFWLLPTKDINILVMIDRFTALDLGTGEVGSRLAELGLTALADPVLLFATAVGRTLPAAAASADKPGGVIVEPTQAALAGALNLFQPLFVAATAAPVTAATTSAVAVDPTADTAAAEGVLTSATEAAGTETLGTAAEAPAAEATTADAATTGTAAAGVVTPSAADVTTTEATTVGAAVTGAAPAGAVAGPAAVELPADFVHMFNDPGIVDAASAVPAVDPGTAVVPRLEISTNQIDAVIADSDSGAGLFVFATDAADTSSLVCSGNRIRSRVAMGATVSLQLLVECTVTGNIVSNEIVGDKQTLSVSLNPRVIPQSVPAVAVTGNVLLGPTRLPARPGVNPPLNLWDVLNTVTTFPGP